MRLTFEFDLSELVFLLLAFLKLDEEDGNILGTIAQLISVLEQWNSFKYSYWSSLQYIKDMMLLKFLPLWETENMKWKSRNTNGN